MIHLCCFLPLLRRVELPPTSHQQAQLKDAWEVLREPSTSSQRLLGKRALGIVPLIKSFCSLYGYVTNHLGMTWKKHLIDNFVEHIPLDMGALGNQTTKIRDY